MARFFKKVYNSVKETVEDDFIDASDEKKVGQNVSLKINANLKTPNGVLLKASAFSHPNGKDVEGTLEPEFKFPDLDLTIKGKLITNNVFEGSVLLNDKIGKGSSVFVTGKLDDKRQTSVEVGLDYINSTMGSCNLKLISPTTFDTDKMDFYGAGVAYWEGVSFALDTKLNISSRDVSNMNGYLEYVSKDISVAAFGKYEKKNEKEKKTYGIGYHQNINDNARGAVEFTHEPKTQISKLRFATNYKFDENSSLKSRVSLAGNKDMRLGFVLKQNLFPSTKLTLTSDINGRLLYDNVKEGERHQFGVSLTFFD